MKLRFEFDVPDDTNPAEFMRLLYQPGFVRDITHDFQYLAQCAILEQAAQSNPNDQRVQLSSERLSAKIDADIASGRLTAGMIKKCQHAVDEMRRNFPGIGNGLNSIFETWMSKGVERDATRDPGTGSPK